MTPGKTGNSILLGGYFPNYREPRNPIKVKTMKLTNKVIPLHSLVSHGHVQRADAAEGGASKEPILAEVHLCPWNQLAHHLGPRMALTLNPKPSEKYS